MALVEFVVTGGNAVDPGEWMSKLAEVGITCELDPTFDIYAEEGFLRVRWQPAKQSAVDAGFELCLGMPAPDVSAEAFAKLLDRYERMAANLRASKLPPAFATAMEEKVVELKTTKKRTQYVRFRVESKNSRPGDYAAAAMCSAAYAALANGELDDRSGERYRGDAALDAMAKSKWLDMPGDDVPFTGWGEEQPVTTADTKKAAVKKPAAKKPAGKPVAKKSAVVKSAAKKPTVVKSAAKTAVAKKPAAKKPAAEKPAAKKPAANKPATKTPVAKKPAAKKPAAQNSAAKKPAKKR